MDAVDVDSPDRMEQELGEEEEEGVVPEDMIEMSKETEMPEVDRLGPVKENGKWVCIRYRFMGVDFDFPYLDESNKELGLKYSEPILKISPRMMKSRTLGVEEGRNPQVPQYLTIESCITEVSWIRKTYHIPEEYELVCPSKRDRINTPPASGVTVYLSHLRAGLRFPLHPLFVDICYFFEIQLGQLAPNVIRSTVSLIMCCRAMGVEVSLELWRRLFFLSQKAGTVEGRCFFFLTRRPNQRHAYNNNPSSIHNWKEEFFYVKSKALEDSGICVDWFSEKKADNAQPDVEKGNYLQVDEELKKWYWNLLLGPYFPEYMMRYSGLELGYELNIEMLRKGSVVNMLKRSGKKRERKAYNSQVKATVTEAEPESGENTERVRPAPPLVVERAPVQPEAPIQVVGMGESSSTRKRKAGKEIVIEDDKEEEIGETDDNPIYCPGWSLRVKDEVTSAKQAEEFFYNGLLPKDRNKTKNLSDVAVGNGFLTQKYQSLMFDVEMLQRLGNLMRINRALRTNNEKASSRITELEASVKKLEEENGNLKKNYAEAEETIKELRKKNEEETVVHNKNMEVLESWKKEAERLHHRYEDEEGKINAATVKAVLNDAVKETYFGWMFDRLARPLAGETAAVLEKMIQEKDPSFKLPKGFARLAKEAEDALYPWQGGEYDLEELLAPPSEGEESEEEESGGVREEGEAAGDVEGVDEPANDE